MAHSQAYIEFVRDMVEAGQEHDLVMRHLSSTADQAHYMGLHVNMADAAFAVFPSLNGPEGWGLYAFRGSNVLVGMGVDLYDIAHPGPKPVLRKRRLGRPVDITAFSVPSFLDARFLDVCWGDSRDVVRIRKAQKRDGGEQAISNMRESITPKGRAWLAKHSPHIDAAIQGMA